MDFTREPIIETVITPKEGCKLVVRSSKSSGQEEYFVDAVEVVSFGSSFFFRSLERPKSFLVPVTDYEILEVREARMVLKNVGLDKSIKIGGGREAGARQAKETPSERGEVLPLAEEVVTGASAEAGLPSGDKTERLDKKRDRRRHYRRRRGREEAVPKEEGSWPSEGTEEETFAGAEKGAGEKIDLPIPRRIEEGEGISTVEPVTTASILTSLLPPPPTLISETIARYKDNALFKGAFFLKDDKDIEEEDEEAERESLEEGIVSGAEELREVELEQPAYGSFEMTEEEEEEVFQQRSLKHSLEGQPVAEPEKPVEPSEGFPVSGETELPSVEDEPKETDKKISNSNHPS